MAQSVEAWWAGLGPIARYSVICPTIIALAITLGFLSPYAFVLIWPSIINDFEIWRIFTAAVFFGKFSFPFLMNVAMFVIYQQRHEQYFGPRMCDHVFMLAFLFLTCTAVAFFLGNIITSSMLTMSLVWVWCKRHEDAVLTLYGFAFKAQYFPWVLVLFHLLLGGSIVDDFAGIVVGHVFFFLMDVVPKTHGVTLLSTPMWLENLFPNSAQRVYGVHIPTARQAPQQEQRRSWGGGQRLGTNQE